MDSRALAPSTSSFASSRPCPRGSKLLAATKRSRTNRRGTRKNSFAPSNFSLSERSDLASSVACDSAKAPDGTPMPIHAPCERQVIRRTAVPTGNGHQIAEHIQSPTGRPNPKSTATGSLVSRQRSLKRQGCQLRLGHRGEFADERCQRLKVHLGTGACPNPCAQRIQGHTCQMTRFPCIHEGAHQGQA